MKLLNGFKILILALFLCCGFSQQSQAQAYYPVSYGSYSGGIYSGWGWYPLHSGYWPWTYYGYTAYAPYGYSYYPYYNYLPQYSTFGSISYSPSTDRVGVAWGYYSQSDAQYASDGYCSVGDCNPVVWVQGGCAAIAKSSEFSAVSWGYHTSRTRARSYAIRACRQSGGTDCRIGAWVCSY